MDAGLAAVLGAIAASMGSVAAAFAQHETARISARADHRRERRQPRHDTYRVFIQKVILVKERVAYDGYEDTTFSEEEALIKAVHESWIDVSLLGPQPVISAAARLRDDALEVVQLMAVTRRLQERVTYMDEEDDALEEELETYSSSVDYLYEAAQALTKSADRFSTVASASLDDDGTVRQFPSKRLKRRRVAEGSAASLD
ncbi:hypothetical protein E6R61_21010 [Streptomyces sp. LRa12]|uniref:hypothetical protein n=1 Tax=Streptomyces sp. LRa12 TaxID=2563107 RepID=UPI00109EA4CE|nr:hypothetical protein [Streptomyces sp. LRa12]THA90183.1 hypothetical protein E6R61_21010 [Streptomyces sp. LRa12]